MQMLVTSKVRRSWFGSCASTFGSRAQARASTFGSRAQARASTRAAIVLALLTSACSSKDPEASSSGIPRNDDDAATASDGGQTNTPPPNTDSGQIPQIIEDASSPTGTGDGGRCVNLQCQQHSCAGGATTTISGIVYDPAGNNPLYNAVVYVPNAAVQPLSRGATCDSCSSLFSGSPIAVAQTDAQGRFKLEKAPDGDNIPLVVQIGKWRRQYTLPKVTSCQDNPQPDKMLRLPKNRMEGDIPNIAISTGQADTLECLLRRIGVDASEYVAGADMNGSVHIFQGSPNEDKIAPNTAPAAPLSPDSLWNSKDSLMRFDILLLSCEGRETDRMNQQALHDYANAGGRVFASHFHYSWFNSGPFGGENLATWNPGSNHIDDIEGDLVTKLSDGKPFPKGQALADWLANVGALENGKLPIKEARNNALVSAANTPSQAWILADENSPAPGATQYFSFNTPTTLVTGPDIKPAYCGRVVFSDLHVGAASGDNSGKPVPTGCANRKLSAQEAALEFMLFDLSACVMQDDLPPEPPPVVILQ